MRPHLTRDDDGDLVPSWWLDDHGAHAPPPGICRACKGVLEADWQLATCARCLDVRRARGRRSR